jgi:hypothetical protein
MARARRSQKRGSKALARVVFSVLGRGLVASTKHDARVREEVASWPEGTLIVLGVAPDGPTLAVRKQNGRLEYLGSAANLAPTLHVQYKNIDVALPVLLGQQGILEAFAEHRSTLAGDIGLGMSLVRCLHIVENYLFPGFITRGILPAPITRESSMLAVYASAFTSSSVEL